MLQPFFPHQALVWPSSLSLLKFCLQAKSPYSCFPIPAYWLHNWSGSCSLSSGLLAHTWLCGSPNVLVPSHSSCSCFPLEGGGRVSMASCPVRRSLQMLSLCTQGRTVRSEHGWTEGSSTERGTTEAGCDR